ncbi:MAG: uracil-DNA glycosylase [Nitrospirota bacterium]|nr:uracil-DNA glycosylase [Nitrospirota bacterium]MDH5767747.1 uracil-DNA glycosylase [Nitrospirota bacterium]
MQKQLIKNIKTILEFYSTLGFERLPIKVAASSRSIARSRESRDRIATTGVRCQEVHASRLVAHEPSLDKEAALIALREEIGECRRCKLEKDRTHIVFGEGNPYSRLMFIGEAPGKEEDLQARPFVGDAGMLLTRLIEKMGFKREDVYIANIVKCRPPMNRDPEKDEIEQCRIFVERQLEIIHPEVIICLGRISAQTLIGNPGLKITAIRGKFFDYNGIPLMPTFHPAYLIRNPKDKWLTWEDAQKVLQKLKKQSGE